MGANPVSFEHTENAFAYKTDGDLRKANFLFSAMRYSALVKLGTAITSWAMKIGLPLKGLIRKTIFPQFVGGETLEATAAVAGKLEKFGVKVILDYGVEGKEGEENFDHSCEAFIKVIDYASTQPNIPFISIKVTGFARISLLEKLDAAASGKSGYTGYVHTEILNDTEKAEWVRVAARMNRIVSAAAEKRIGVLVDAEETWIQDPVDALTMQMMDKYNRGRSVVYNTIQIYRADRFRFFRESFNCSSEKGFLLAVKLVRGAYMEKERKRAAELGYPSPIQPDKQRCDDDYNEALKFGISRIDNIGMIIATHNEQSNGYAVELMREQGVAVDHPHIHFSQLLGMSDNITFNLAKAGYPVSKYLPFGPISDVIPYLMRRAQENSSVAGQTGRELSLIKRELKRRKTSR